MGATVVSRRHILDNWADKRAAYRASKSERAYELLADQGAIDLARRQMQALAIIEKYAGLFESQIPNYEARIKEGKTPKYEEIVDTTFAKKAIEQVGEWKGPVCPTAAF